MVNENHSFDVDEEARPLPVDTHVAGNEGGVGANRVGRGEHTALATRLQRAPEPGEVNVGRHHDRGI